jgi:hypothetical protein
MQQNNIYKHTLYYVVLVRKQRQQTRDNLPLCGFKRLVVHGDTKYLPRTVAG